MKICNSSTAHTHGIETDCISYQTGNTKQLQVKTSDYTELGKATYKYKLYPS